MVSMHWGPNYSWLPDDSLQKLAHFFIDNGVDLIHGHSSHHIQAGLLRSISFRYGLVSLNI